MKILHITPSLSNAWGGPTRVIKGLTESLNKKGVTNTILTTSGYRVGNVQDNDLQSHIRVFPTQPLSTLWTGYSKDLKKSLPEEVRSHDVVHIHELWHFPHFAAYLSARQENKPYCISVHGHLSPWALNHKKLRKQIYMNLFQSRTIERASVLHAVTQEEINNIHDLGITNETRLIPNGISTSKHYDSVSGSDFINSYPNLSGKTILLFLGRIHPVKGLDLLSEALKEIVQTNPNVHLVIAGPDENGYKKHIIDILKRNGISKNCTFTGMLSDIEKTAALKASNILVLPSYSEVMGISTLEGMEAGLPVVITEGCQFPEIERNGAGVVVSHNATDLSNAILYLLDNPNIAQHMGTIGKQLISDKYNWDNISDLYIQLYTDIISKHYEPND